MFSLIASSIYFIAPAYLANMAPVIAGKLKLPLGQPISKKYLGENKTYRGFYAGYLGALAMLFLQKYLYSQGFLIEFSLLDYDLINVYFFAFLFGFGAILGDSVKSFFKRRVGVKSGDSWFPFDQLDFIIFSLLFLYPFVEIQLSVVITLILVTPALHLLTNIVAYKLGWKKVWW